MVLDCSGNLSLAFNRHSIEGVAQIKQAFATLNLFIGLLEQNTKHLIGHQRRFARFAGKGASAGQCSRRCIGPGVSWDWVEGVLAEFVKRFD
ncbi:hypothetical protein D3C87_1657200 [compost metagenome]